MYFFGIVKKNAPIFTKSGLFFLVFCPFCSQHADFFHFIGAYFQLVVPLLSKSTNQSVANALVDVHILLPAKFSGTSAHGGLFVVVHCCVFADCLQSDRVELAGNGFNEWRLSVNLPSRNAFSMAQRQAPLSGISTLVSL